jgi:hypothetical protein
MPAARLATTQSPASTSVTDRRSSANYRLLYRDSGRAAGGFLRPAVLAAIAPPTRASVDRGYRRLLVQALRWIEGEGEPGPRPVRSPVFLRRPATPGPVHRHPMIRMESTVWSSRRSAITCRKARSNQPSELKSVHTGTCGPTPRCRCLAFGVKRRPGSSALESAPASARGMPYTVGPLSLEGLRQTDSGRTDLGRRISVN